MHMNFNDDDDDDDSSSNIFYGQNNITYSTNCIYSTAGTLYTIETPPLQVCNCKNGARGGVVVKTLSYKPAGRGFNCRWCHWNFSLT